jgi:hypothetical protein
MEVKVLTKVKQPRKEGRGGGSILAARNDLVLKSDSLNVLFDGDLSHFRGVLSKWRCMIQEMENLVEIVEKAVADFSMKKKVVSEIDDPKHPGEKKKVSTWVPTDYVIVRMKLDDAKQAATSILGKDVNLCETKYQEWYRKWQELDVSMGGPHFDRRMFEQAIKIMGAIRNKKVPDRGNIPRNHLVVAGAAKQPWFGNVPLECIYASQSNVFRAKFVKEGNIRKVVLMLNDKDEDAKLTFVVRGAIVDKNGKPHTIGTKKSDRVFDNYFEGRWIPTNPRANIDKRGYCHLYVSNYRPRRAFTGLLDANTLEVTFHKINGEDIRKPWRPEKEQDRLTGRVFTIHTRIMRGNKRSWPANIAINDAIAAMRGYSKRMDEKRECWNTRRFGPKRLRRPFQEIIDNISKAKERTQRQINHRWTNEVIFQATRKGRCRTIRLYGFPDGVKAGLLLDGTVQWPWSEWLRMLIYKAEEAGCFIELVTTQEDINAMGVALHEELTRVKHKEEEEEDDDEAEYGPEAA